MEENTLTMTVCTCQTANPAAPGLIFIQIYKFGDNPLKYTDPDGRDWERSGEFNVDYSNVPDATVPYHLGEDWVYINEAGENATIGREVPSLTAGTVSEVGSNNANGNFVRVTDGSGRRMDYFHLEGADVTAGTVVESGTIIGRAGDTGAGNAHLHIAESYPQGQAPADSGTTINAYGRTYVDPPDVPVD
jgi:hypothetical protein